MTAHFLGAMLALLSPVQGIDWEKPADRAVMATGFNNMAEFCSLSFGFVRIAPAGADEADKIEAFLLLEDSAEYRVDRWINIIRAARTLEKAPEDDAFIDRLVDSVFAAVKDPSTYDRALKLYSDTFMAPLRATLQACSDASADPFLGKNYVTGTGSADRFHQKIPGKFAAAVSDLKRELARQTTPAK